MPKSVRACWNNGGRSLAVWTFKKADPDKKTRAPFKCRTWRCVGNDGECARHERHVTYARMKEAIERNERVRREPRGWMFMVLTLDRDGFASGKPWRDADEAYSALSRMSRKLLERLRRWMKKAGMRPLGNEWVAVVEAHRSNWPHVNFLLWSPELANYVEREQAAFAHVWEAQGFKASQLPPELLGLATATRWGQRATIERVRSQDAVLNYVAKLSGEAGQAMGELSKLTQLPYAAPQRFRRLRAGKGWLPPRRKNEEITGSVVMRKFDDRDGSPIVMPVATIKNPALVAHMAEACYEEGRRWERERENFGALRAALAEAAAIQVRAELEPDAELRTQLVAAAKAATRDAYERFGTPLLLTVSLPVPLAKPPPLLELATGPPATAPPANDTQLMLF